MKEVKDDASKPSSSKKKTAKSSSAGRDASKSKSKSSSSSSDDDDVHPDGGEHTFETELKIKAYDVSKKDIKLIRAATLSLLDARARGACDDDRLSLRKTTDADGAVRITITCPGVPTANLLDRAHDAVRWAFDGARRFGANLVKIGFKAGDATDIELATDA